MPGSRQKLSMKEPFIFNRVKYCHEVRLWNLTDFSNSEIKVFMDSDISRYSGRRLYSEDAVRDAIAGLAQHPDPHVRAVSERVIGDIEQGNLVIFAHNEHNVKTNASSRWIHPSNSTPLGTIERTIDGVKVPVPYVEVRIPYSSENRHGQMSDHLHVKEMQENLYAAFYQHYAYQTTGKINTPLHKLNSDNVYTLRLEKPPEPSHTVADEEVTIEVSDANYEDMAPFVLNVQEEGVVGRFDQCYKGIIYHEKDANIRAFLEAYEIIEKINPRLHALIEYLFQEKKLALFLSRSSHPQFSVGNRHWHVHRRVSAGEYEEGIFQIADACICITSIEQLTAEEIERVLLTEFLSYHESLSSVAQNKLLVKQLRRNYLRDLADVLESNDLSLSQVMRNASNLQLPLGFSELFTLPLMQLRASYSHCFHNLCHVLPQMESEWPLFEIKFNQILQEIIQGGQQTLELEANLEKHFEELFSDKNSYIVGMQKELFIERLAQTLQDFWENLPGKVVAASLSSENAARLARRCMGTIEDYCVQAHPELPMKRPDLLDNGVRQLGYTATESESSTSDAIDETVADTPQIEEGARESLESQAESESSTSAIDEAVAETAEASEVMQESVPRPLVIDDEEFSLCIGNHFFQEDSQRQIFNEVMDFIKEKNLELYEKLLHCNQNGLLTLLLHSAEDKASVYGHCEDLVTYGDEVIAMALQGHYLRLNVQGASIQQLAEAIAIGFHQFECMQATGTVYFLNNHPNQIALIDKVYSDQLSYLFRNRPREYSLDFTHEVLYTENSVQEVMVARPMLAFNQYMQQALQSISDELDLELSPERINDLIKQMNRLYTTKEDDNEVNELAPVLSLSQDARLSPLLREAYEQARLVRAMHYQASLALARTLYSGVLNATMMNVSSLHDILSFLEPDEIVPNVHECYEKIDRSTRRSGGGFSDDDRRPPGGGSGSAVKDQKIKIDLWKNEIEFSQKLSGDRAQALILRRQATFEANGLYRGLIRFNMRENAESPVVMTAYSALESIRFEYPDLYAYIVRAIHFGEITLLASYNIGGDNVGFCGMNQELTNYTIRSEFGRFPLGPRFIHLNTCYGIGLCKSNLAHEIVQTMLYSERELFFGENTASSTGHGPNEMAARARLHGEMSAYLRHKCPDLVHLKYLDGVLDRDVLKMASQLIEGESYMLEPFLSYLRSDVMGLFEGEGPLAHLANESFMERISHALQKCELRFLLKPDNYGKFDFSFILNELSGNDVELFVQHMEESGIENLFWDEAFCCLQQSRVENSGLIKYFPESLHAIESGVERCCETQSDRLRSTYSTEKTKTIEPVKVKIGEQEVALTSESDLILSDNGSSSQDAPAEKVKACIKHEIRVMADLMKAQLERGQLTLAAVSKPGLPAFSLHRCNDIATIHAISPRGVYPRTGDLLLINTHGLAIDQVRNNLYQGVHYYLDQTFELSRDPYFRQQLLNELFATRDNSQVTSSTEVIHTSQLQALREKWTQGLRDLLSGESLNLSLTGADIDDIMVALPTVMEHRLNHINICLEHVPAQRQVAFRRALMKFERTWFSEAYGVVALAPSGTNIPVIMSNSRKFTNIQLANLSAEFAFKIERCNPVNQINLRQLEARYNGPPSGGSGGNGGSNGPGGGGPSGPSGPGDGKLPRIDILPRESGLMIRQTQPRTFIKGLLLDHDGNLRILDADFHGRFRPKLRFRFNSASRYQSALYTNRPYHILIMRQTGDHFSCEGLEAYWHHDLRSGQPGGGYLDQTRPLLLQPWVKAALKTVDFGVHAYLAVQEYQDQMSRPDCSGPDEAIANTVIKLGATRYAIGAIAKVCPLILIGMAADNMPDFSHQSRCKYQEQMIGVLGRYTRGQMTHEALDAATHAIRENYELWQEIEGNRRAWAWIGKPGNAAIRYLGELVERPLPQPLAEGFAMVRDATDHEHVPGQLMHGLINHTEQSARLIWGFTVGQVETLVESAKTSSKKLADFGKFLGETLETAALSRSGFGNAQPSTSSSQRDNVLAEHHRQQMNAMERQRSELLMQNIDIQIRKITGQNAKGYAPSEGGTFAGRYSSRDGVEVRTNSHGELTIKIDKDSPFALDPDLNGFLSSLGAEGTTNKSADNEPSTDSPDNNWSIDWNDMPEEGITFTDDEVAAAMPANNFSGQGTGSPIEISSIRIGKVGDKVAVIATVAGGATVYIAAGGGEAIFGCSAAFGPAFWSSLALGAAVVGAVAAVLLTARYLYKHHLEKIQSKVEKFAKYTGRDQTFINGQFRSLIGHVNAGNRTLEQQIAEANHLARDLNEKIALETDRGTELRGNKRPEDANEHFKASRDYHIRMQNLRVIQSDLQQRKIQLGFEKKNEGKSAQELLDLAKLLTSKPSYTSHDHAQIDGVRALILRKAQGLLREGDILELNGLLEGASALTFFKPGNAKPLTFNKGMGKIDKNTMGDITTINRKIIAINGVISSGGNPLPLIDDLIDHIMNRENVQANWDERKGNRHDLNDKDPSYVSCQQWVARDKAFSTFLNKLIKLKNAYQQGNKALTLELTGVQEIVKDLWANRNKPYGHWVKEFKGTLVDEGVALSDEQALTRIFAVDRIHEQVFAAAFQKNFTLARQIVMSFRGELPGNQGYETNRMLRALGDLEPYMEQGFLGIVEFIGLTKGKEKLLPKDNYSLKIAKHIVFSEIVDLANHRDFTEAQLRLDEMEGTHESLAEEVAAYRELFKSWDDRKDTGYVNWLPDIESYLKTDPKKRTEVQTRGYLKAQGEIKSEFVSKLLSGDEAGAREVILVLRKADEGNSSQHDELLSMAGRLAPMFANNASNEDCLLYISGLQSTKTEDRSLVYGDELRIVENYLVARAMGQVMSGETEAGIHLLENIEQTDRSASPRIRSLLSMIQSWERYASGDEYTAFSIIANNRIKLGVEKTERDNYDLMWAKSRVMGAYKSKLFAADSNGVEEILSFYRDADPASLTKINKLAVIAERLMPKIDANVPFRDWIEDIRALQASDVDGSNEDEIQYIEDFVVVKATGLLMARPALVADVFAQLSNLRPDSAERFKKLSASFQELFDKRFDMKYCIEYLNGHRNKPMANLAEGDRIALSVMKSIVMGQVVAKICSDDPDGATDLLFEYCQAVYGNEGEEGRVINMTLSFLSRQNLKDSEFWFQELDAVLTKLPGERNELEKAVYDLSYGVLMRQAHEALASNKGDEAKAIFAKLKEKDPANAPLMIALIEQGRGTSNAVIDRNDETASLSLLRRLKQEEETRQYERKAKEQSVDEDEIESEQNAEGQKQKDVLSRAQFLSTLAALSQRCSDLAKAGYVGRAAHLQQEMADEGLIVLGEADQKQLADAFFQHNNQVLGAILRPVMETLSAAVQGMEPGAARIFMRGLLESLDIAQIAGINAATVALSCVGDSCTVGRHWGNFADTFMKDINSITDLAHGELPTLNGSLILAQVLLKAMQYAPIERLFPARLEPYRPSFLTKQNTLWAGSKGVQSTLLYQAGCKLLEKEIGYGVAAFSLLPFVNLGFDFSSWGYDKFWQHQGQAIETTDHYKPSTARAAANGAVLTCAVTQLTIGMAGAVAWPVTMGVVAFSCYNIYSSLSNTQHQAALSAMQASLANIFYFGSLRAFMDYMVQAPIQLVKEALTNDQVKLVKEGQAIFIQKDGDDYSLYIMPQEQGIFKSLWNSLPVVGSKNSDYIRMTLTKHKGLISSDFFDSDAEGANEISMKRRNSLLRRIVLAHMLPILCADSFISTYISRYLGNIFSSLLTDFHTRPVTADYTGRCIFRLLPEEPSSDDLGKVENGSEIILARIRKDNSVTESTTPEQESVDEQTQSPCECEYFIYLKAVSEVGAGHLKCSIPSGYEEVFDLLRDRNALVLGQDNLYYPEVVILASTTYMRARIDLSLSKMRSTLTATFSDMSFEHSKTLPDGRISANDMRRIHLSLRIQEAYARKAFDEMLALTELCQGGKFVKDGYEIPVLDMWQLLVFNRLRFYAETRERLTQFYQEYRSYSEALHRAASADDKWYDEHWRRRNKKGEDKSEVGIKVLDALDSIVSMALYNMVVTAYQLSRFALHSSLPYLAMLTRSYPFAKSYFDLLTDDLKFMVAHLYYLLGDERRCRLFYKSIENPREFLRERTQNMPDFSPREALAILGCADEEEHTRVLMAQDSEGYELTLNIIYEQTSKLIERGRYQDALEILYHNEILRGSYDDGRTLQYWELLNQMIDYQLKVAGFLPELPRRYEALVLLYGLKLICIEHILTGDISVDRSQVANKEKRRATHNLYLYLRRLPGNATLSTEEIDAKVSEMMTRGRENLCLERVRVLNEVFSNAAQSFSLELSHDARVTHYLPVDVPPDGDCFFHCLGVTRAEAMDRLIRKVNKLEWSDLHSGSKKAAIFSMLLEDLNRSLVEGKANIEENFAENKQTVLTYLRQFSRPRTFMPYNQDTVSIMDVIALLYERNLRIFVVQENGDLRLASSHVNDASFTTFDILHTSAEGYTNRPGRLNHYVKLAETTAQVSELSATSSSEDTSVMVEVASSTASDSEEMSDEELAGIGGIGGEEEASLQQSPGQQSVFARRDVRPDNANSNRAQTADSTPLCGIL